MPFFRIAARSRAPSPSRTFHLDVASTGTDESRGRDEKARARDFIYAETIPYKAAFILGVERAYHDALARHAELHERVARGADRAKATEGIGRILRYVTVPCVVRIRIC